MIEIELILAQCGALLGAVLHLGNGSTAVFGDDATVAVQQHKRWDSTHAKASAQPLLDLALTVWHSQPRHRRKVRVEATLVLIRLNKNNFKLLPGVFHLGVHPRKHRCKLPAWRAPVC